MATALGNSWRFRDDLIEGRHHVNQVDVADHGTVYATVLYGCPTDGCNSYDDLDWSLGDLYAITPEAVAPAE